MQRDAAQVQRRARLEYAKFDDQGGALRLIMRAETQQVPEAFSRLAKARLYRRQHGLMAKRTHLQPRFKWLYMRVAHRSPQRFQVMSTGQLDPAQLAVGLPIRGIPVFIIVHA
ncbi:hypothetical protein D9M73_214790 [compost metagenome]